MVLWEETEQLHTCNKMQVIPCLLNYVLLFRTNGGLNYRSLLRRGFLLAESSR
jgi:hypothetical protein